MHPRFARWAASTTPQSVRVAAVLFVVLAMLASGAQVAGAAAKRAGTKAGLGGTHLTNYPATADFYRLPKHVAPAPPGTIVRLQTVSEANGYETLRVMYHSRAVSGRDALVTGLVTYPTTAPPKGGWPVISWDHGTSGVSQSCAGSRGTGSSPTFGVRGVSVATDYLGLGPDGEIHPYLNRKTEAEATIDIVRAVRTIPDAHASSRWIVVGDSQGGQAAMATGEIAPSYAPDLHLIGTVAVAPGALLSQTFPGDNSLVVDTVTLMAVFGASKSDPHFKFDSLLVPGATGAAHVLETGCVLQVGAYVLGVLSKSGKLFTTPPLKTPEGRAWVKENDVPQVHTPSPMLLIAGGADIVVVPARMNAVMKRVCKLGDRASIHWYPTANHTNETAVATPLIRSWIEARLRGTKAPTSCPYTPPATSKI